MLFKNLLCLVYLINTAATLAISKCVRREKQLHVDLNALSHTRGRYDQRDEASFDAKAELDESPRTSKKTPKIHYVDYIPDKELVYETTAGSDDLNFGINDDAINLHDDSSIWMNRDFERQSNKHSGKRFGFWKKRYHNSTKERKKNEDKRPFKLFQWNSKRKNKAVDATKPDLVKVRDINRYPPSKCKEIVKGLNKDGKHQRYKSLSEKLVLPKMSASNQRRLVDATELDKFDDKTRLNSAVLSDFPNAGNYGKPNENIHLVDSEVVDFGFDSNTTKKSRRRRSHDIHSAKITRHKSVPCRLSYSPNIIASKHNKRSALATETPDSTTIILTDSVIQMTNKNVSKDTDMKEIDQHMGTRNEILERNLASSAQIVTTGSHTEANDMLKTLPSKEQISEINGKTLTTKSCKKGETSTTLIMESNAEICEQKQTTTQYNNGNNIIIISTSAIEALLDHVKLYARTVKPDAQEYVVRIDASAPFRASMLAIAKNDDQNKRTIIEKITKLDNLEEDATQIETPISKIEPKEINNNNNKEALVYSTNNQKETGHRKDELNLDETSLEHSKSKLKVKENMFDKQNVEDKSKILNNRIDDYNLRNETYETEDNNPKSTLIKKEYTTYDTKDQKKEKLKPKCVVKNDEKSKDLIFLSYSPKEEYSKDMVQIKDEKITQEEKYNAVKRDNSIQKCELREPFKDTRDEKMPQEDKVKVTTENTQETPNTKLKNTILYQRSNVQEGTSKLSSNPIHINGSSLVYSENTGVTHFVKARSIKETSMKAVTSMKNAISNVRNKILNPKKSNHTTLKTTSPPTKAETTKAPQKEISKHLFKIGHHAPLHAEKNYMHQKAPRSSHVFKKEKNADARNNNLNLSDDYILFGDDSSDIESPKRAVEATTDMSSYIDLNLDPAILEGKDLNENILEKYQETYDTLKRVIKDSQENTNPYESSTALLNNSISSDDIMSGYKYYLQFQRENNRDEKNFSNLVKYEAHKRHSVDDIGKFISKIIPIVSTSSNLDNIRVKRNTFAFFKQISAHGNLTSERDEEDKIHRKGLRNLVNIFKYQNTPLTLMSKHHLLSGKKNKETTMIDKYNEFMAEFKDVNAFTPPDPSKYEKYSKWHSTAHYTNLAKPTPLAKKTTTMKSYNAKKSKSTKETIKDNAQTKPGLFYNSWNKNKSMKSKFKSKRNKTAHKTVELMLNNQHQSYVDESTNNLEGIHYADMTVNVKQNREPIENGELGSLFISTIRHEEHSPKTEEVANDFVNSMDLQNQPNLQTEPKGYRKSYKSLEKIFKKIKFRKSSKEQESTTKRNQLFGSDKIGNLYETPTQNAITVNPTTHKANTFHAKPRLMNLFKASLPIMNETNTLDKFNWEAFNLNIKNALKDTCYGIVPISTESSLQKSSFEYDENMKEEGTFLKKPNYFNKLGGVTKYKDNITNHKDRYTSEYTNVKPNTFKLTKIQEFNDEHNFNKKCFGTTKSSTAFNGAIDQGVENEPMFDTKEYNYENDKILNFRKSDMEVKYTNKKTSNNNIFAVKLSQKTTPLLENNVDGPDDDNPEKYLVNNNVGNNEHLSTPGMEAELSQMYQRLFGNVYKYKAPFLNLAVTESQTENHINGFTIAFHLFDHLVSRITGSQPKIPNLITQNNAHNWDENELKFKSKEESEVKKNKHLFWASTKHNILTSAEFHGSKISNANINNNTFLQIQGLEGNPDSSRNTQNLESRNYKTSENIPNFTQNAPKKNNYILGKTTDKFTYPNSKFINALSNQAKFDKGLKKKIKFVSVPVYIRGKPESKNFLNLSPNDAFKFFNDDKSTITRFTKTTKSKDDKHETDYSTEKHNKILRIDFDIDKRNNRGNVMKYVNQVSGNVEYHTENDIARPEDQESRNYDEPFNGQYKRFAKFFRIKDGETESPPIISKKTVTKTFWYKWKTNKKSVSIEATSERGSSFAPNSWTNLVLNSYMADDLELAKTMPSVSKKEIPIERKRDESLQIIEMKPCSTPKIITVNSQPKCGTTPYSKMCFCKKSSCSKCNASKTSKECVTVVDFAQFLKQNHIDVDSVIKPVKPEVLENEIKGMLHKYEPVIPCNPLTQTSKPTIDYLQNNNIIDSQTLNDLIIKSNYVTEENCDDKVTSEITPTQMCKPTTDFLQNKYFIDTEKLNNLIQKSNHVNSKNDKNIVTMDKLFKFEQLWSKSKETTASEHTQTTRNIKNESKVPINSTSKPLKVGGHKVVDSEGLFYDLGKGKSSKEHASVPLPTIDYLTFSLYPPKNDSDKRNKTVIKTVPEVEYDEEKDIFLNDYGPGLDYLDWTVQLLRDQSQTENKTKIKTLDLNQKYTSSKSDAKKDLLKNNFQYSSKSDDHGYDLENHKNREEMIKLLPDSNTELEYINFPQISQIFEPIPKKYDDDEYEVTILNLYSKTNCSKTTSTSDKSNENESTKPFKASIKTTTVTTKKCNNFTNQDYDNEITVTVKTTIRHNDPVVNAVNKASEDENNLPAETSKNQKSKFCHKNLNVFSDLFAGRSYPAHNVMLFRPFTAISSSSTTERTATIVEYGDAHPKSKSSRAGLKFTEIPFMRTLSQRHADTDNFSDESLMIQVMALSDRLGVEEKKSSMKRKPSEHSKAAPNLKLLVQLTEIVEAVENRTRPNAKIHVDLPTYYDPIPATASFELYADRPTKLFGNGVAKNWFGPGPDGFWCKYCGRTTLDIDSMLKDLTMMSASIEGFGSTTSKDFLDSISCGLWKKCCKTARVGVHGAFSAGSSSREELNDWTNATEVFSCLDREKDTRENRSIAASRSCNQEYKGAPVKRIIREERNTQENAKAASIIYDMNTSVKTKRGRFHHIVQRLSNSLHLPKYYQKSSTNVLTSPALTSADSTKHASTTTASGAQELVKLTSHRSRIVAGDKGVKSRTKTASGTTNRAPSPTRKFIKKAKKMIMSEEYDEPDYDENTMIDRPGLKKNHNNLKVLVGTTIVTGETTTKATTVIAHLSTLSKVLKTLTNGDFNEDYELDDFHNVRMKTTFDVRLPNKKQSDPSLELVTTPEGYALTNQISRDSKSNSRENIYNEKSDMNAIDQLDAIDVKDNFGNEEFGEFNPRYDGSNFGGINADVRAINFGSFDIRNDMDLQYGESKKKKGAMLKRIRNSNKKSQIKEEKEINFKIITISRHKREPKSFTARNVAKLEVVVDVSEEVTSKPHLLKNPTLKLPKDTDTQASNVNLLQLHIVLPNHHNKNVKNVFSAQLSNPVDMAYKIDTTPEINQGSHEIAKPPAIPKGCLLVNNENRRVLYETITSVTNSNPEIANVEKKYPRLSKTFIAKIREELDEIYEDRKNVLVKHNSTKRAAAHSSVHDQNYKSNVYSDNGPEIRTHCQTVKKKKHGKYSKFIRALFGFGDHVCSCKCHVNKCMCKTCAASSEVISELFFEFENIAKYMEEHCTEIQTFFWMNPTEGKRLQGLVRRIHKMIEQYVTRVRGKCKGESCNNLTSMEKRHIPSKKELRIKNLLQLIREAREMVETLVNSDCFFTDGLNFANQTRNVSRVLANCINSGLRNGNPETFRLENENKFDNSVVTHPAVLYLGTEQNKKRMEGILSSESMTSLRTDNLVRSRAGRNIIAKTFNKKIFINGLNVDQIGLDELHKYSSTTYPLVAKNKHRLTEVVNSKRLARRKTHHKKYHVKLKRFSRNTNDDLVHEEEALERAIIAIEYLFHSTIADKGIFKKSKKTETKAHTKINALIPTDTVHSNMHSMQLNNLVPTYLNDENMRHKRESSIWCENPVLESPLITDSGGSFWYGYLKKGPSSKRYPRKIPSMPELTNPFRKPKIRLIDYLKPKKINVNNPTKKHSGVTSDAFFAKLHKTIHGKYCILNSITNNHHMSSTTSNLAHIITVMQSENNMLKNTNISLKCVADGNITLTETGMSGNLTKSLQALEKIISHQKSVLGKKAKNMNNVTDKKIIQTYETYTNKTKSIKAPIILWTDENRTRELDSTLKSTLNTLKDLLETSSSPFTKLKTTTVNLKNTNLLSKVGFSTEIIKETKMYKVKPCIPQIKKTNFTLDMTSAMRNNGMENNTNYNLTFSRKEPGANSSNISDYINVINAFVLNQPQNKNAVFNLYENETSVDIIFPLDRLVTHRNKEIKYPSFKILANDEEFNENANVKVVKNNIATTQRPILYHAGPQVDIVLVTENTKTSLPKPNQNNPSSSDLLQKKKRNRNVFILDNEPLKNEIDTNIKKYQDAALPSQLISDKIAYNSAEKYDGLERLVDDNNFEIKSKKNTETIGNNVDGEINVEPMMNAIVKSIGSHKDTSTESISDMQHHLDINRNKDDQSRESRKYSQYKKRENVVPNKLNDATHSVWLDGMHMFCVLCKNHGSEESQSLNATTLMPNLYWDSTEYLIPLLSNINLIKIRENTQASLTKSTMEIVSKKAKETVEDHTVLPSKVPMRANLLHKVLKAIEMKCKLLENAYDGKPSNENIPHTSLKTRAISQNPEPSSTKKCPKKYFRFTKFHSSVKADNGKSKLKSTSSVIHVDASKVNSTKAPDSNIIKDGKDTCDPTKRDSNCVCDMDKTIDTIHQKYHQMKPADFDNYVRNITCERYINMPKQFVITLHRKERDILLASDKYFSSESEMNDDRFRRKRSKNVAKYQNDIQISDQRTGTLGKEFYRIHLKKLEDIYDENNGRGNMKWNWIRNKRSLKKDCSDEENVKGHRRKRYANVDLSAFKKGLFNLPEFELQKGEIYVHRGDIFSIDCSLNVTIASDTNSEYVWRTDREGMMALANVVVEGQTMTVRDAQVDNMGVYNCTRDNVIVKSQRVTLVTAPRYELVYVLLYDAGETCELEDLRALHGELPAAVEAATCAHGRLCRVAVSEPVCLKPRGGKAGARRLRAEGASAAVEGGGGAVPCGARCRVTLQAGLAVLAATAVPAVLNTDVVLSTEAGNRTLRALIETDADEAGWHVSRALPKKERGSTEFHKLSSRMSSGELNLVLICGAGFYLIPHQKICVACPMGHYSRAGETSCRRCPAGRSTAAPGAAVCTRRGHRPHAANVQLHRYTRWLPELSPSSGALVAAGLLAGAAAAVTALSLLQCRGCRTGKSVEEGMGPAGMRTAAAAPPSRRASRTVTRARDRAVRVQRALSPSSVLLGFRARDAAPHHPRPRPVMLEEILEMPLPELPEDNRPPLPPIDFDL